MDERERRIRIKLRDDLCHYALKCLTIRTKAGGLKNLELNQAQRFLHNALEKQRSETGKVRALIVKGRQEGTSTYTQARFFHKTTHAKGVRAFILTHDREATSNIFDMVQRFHDNLPALVKPHADASNANELHFGHLSSGYRVGTAGSKAVGRSQTIQLFHGSEVAYWANDEEHWGGALQAVANMPGTEIILESTSAGPSGKFYEACMAAYHGEGEYQLVFLPWFWMDEYTIKDTSIVPSNEENDLATEFNLTTEQLVWRRTKIAELGLSGFQREYPNTIEEAFKADAPGALWHRENIAAFRVRADQLPPARRIVIGVDPAVTATEKSDETGIVAVMLGQDNHVYVLSDYSGKYTPEGWAASAIAAYHKHSADRIVAEGNQGGDMIEAVIRKSERGDSVGFKKVVAKRGKRARAEPVSALYERGVVHHVGHHDGLEDQCCTWNASRDDESPDRVDALVWAITELVLDSNTGILDYYKQLSTARTTPHKGQDAVVTSSQPTQVVGESKNYEEYYNELVGSVKR